ncbi:cupin domain-containing protein [Nocardia sp. CA2R105]|uniref:cupin domain-containing protein n=1 Tax=Nocardia coffeae TaxID=2873381 RepID=UPI001CA74704|nr:cupin domain-containing protein [Nocardia coffeae]MBY8863524.1 cupin domain-containing protein [Nocardia coffeae]
MHFRSADTDVITRENNCDLRRLYPWQDVVVPPWNSSLVSIRPQESSKEHHHATDETFIFTSGVGTVTIDGEQRPIAPGDVVYIPHGQDHIVTNTSTDAPLDFVSIYWLQPEERQA